MTSTSNKVKDQTAKNLVDYIYEQPRKELFKALVLRYVDSEIYRILLESSAAEHGARMAAMYSATTSRRAN